MWNGINVDFWSQEQTIRPPKKLGNMMYSGDDYIWPGIHWWDFIPAIPLDMRFASFKRRLDKALNR